MVGEINMEKNELVIHKMAEIFVETMQQMAFIDIAPVEKKFSFSQEALAVKLEVLMPYTGDLIVVFDKDLAKEFASNVFGEAQINLINEPLADATSEFMNVIIGKIFAVFAPDMLFELGLPKSISAVFDSSPYVVQSYVSPEGKNMAFYFRSDRLLAAFEHEKKK